MFAPLTAVREPKFRSPTLRKLAFIYILTGACHDRNGHFDAIGSFIFGRSILFNYAGEFQPFAGKKILLQAGRLQSG